MSHSFKQITPTDHFGWHAALLPVYERLFAPLRKTSNWIMEIGTDGGGGMLMYGDYFLNALVLGIDINPTPQAIKDANVLKFEHIQRDAYNEHTINFVKDYEPFSVIIDDGSHFLEHQLFFCRNYPQFLTEDGIAIIEDVQNTDYIEQFNDALPEGFMGFAIDLRYAEPRRYDNLIFCIVRV